MKKSEKYKCPCCGYYTLAERAGGTYEVCPVCYWEDDPIQLEDETYEDGANKVSLKQARRNFLIFGACEERLIKYVRPPREDELTGIE
ncbi:MAG: hydrolase [Lachnospiraceae bacterium]|nr:hydrolase [Lachnospiraceae bacterium]